MFIKLDMSSVKAGCEDIKKMIFEFWRGKMQELKLGDNPDSPDRAVAIGLCI